MAIRGREAINATQATVLLDLIGETRLALATLATDDLEALAARAQEVARQLNVPSFDKLRTGDLDSEMGASAPPSRATLQQLASSHRILGDLLHATSGNLAVLKRLQQRRRGGEANSSWEH